MLDQIIHYLLTHEDVILALFGGGAGLSVFLQALLHKADIDSKKLAYTLIHLLSLAAAFAGFYLDNINVLPAYAGLVIAAQTVHRFIVSPYYNSKILPYLTFLSENAITQGQPSPVYAEPAAPIAQASFVA